MSDGQRAGRVPASTWVVRLAVAAVAVLLPALLTDYWVELGALVFASAIGAVGLMLLFGRVGQLSLGHPFFLAIGAYGYVWLASPPGEESLGVGVPSLLAVCLATLLAAIAGLVLSPIASRLKGLSLGLATLALVYIGAWLLYTLESLTGGYNGRSVPVLRVGDFTSAGSNLAVLGLPIGRAEFLWYLSVALLTVVGVFTTRLLRSRVGRAFSAVKDAEVQAAALGVEVARYRAIAFALSSAYAGLAGALLAVIIQFVVPDYWGLTLSLSYLAMVVIGGMRSVSGAVLGAVFVTMLPAMLQRYGDTIPFVGGAGGDGLGAAVVAQLVYGGVLVAVLLFEPEGLTRIAARLSAHTVRSSPPEAEPEDAAVAARPG